MLKQHRSLKDEMDKHTSEVGRSMSSSSNQVVYLDETSFNLW
jgi:hypothetical protein